MNNNDLDKARHTKNKNTRQQNLLTKEQIRKSVTWLRENLHSIPRPISNYFFSQGINWTIDLLIDFED